MGKEIRPLAKALTAEMTASPGCSFKSGLVIKVVKDDPFLPDESVKKFDDGRREVFE